MSLAYAQKSLSTSLVMSHDMWRQIQMYAMCALVNGQGHVHCGQKALQKGTDKLPVRNKCPA
eukprot:692149-Pelagomonas_calceolata.AAC.1